MRIEEEDGVCFDKLACSVVKLLRVLSGLFSLGGN
jgi:hypothetical protein